jgi:Spy/CpxP family protein refolding chaperone
MKRLIVAVALIVPMILLSANSSGQDTPKEKGYTPSGWKQLNLTADQKAKLSSIRTDYKAKMDELNKKIEELKKEEHAKMVDVLTDGQKEKLKTIVGVPDSSKPDDKKSPDKKPDDKKPSDK